MFNLENDIMFERLTVEEEKKVRAGDGDNLGGSEDSGTHKPDQLC